MEVWSTVPSSGHGVRSSWCGRMPNAEGCPGAGAIGVTLRR